MGSKRKGQRYKFVTLRDTGEFYRSFQLKRKSKLNYDINTIDYKADYLMKKYGKDILGITKENLKEIKNKIIIPQLKKKLIKTLK